MIGFYFVGFVNSVLTLVTAFGLALSSSQIGSIDLAVNAGLLLLGAIFKWKIQSNTDPNNPIVTAPSKSTVE